MPHRFSVSQWWPLVERYRPTWLNVVPTIIAYLLNGPDRSRPRRRRPAAACASRARRPRRCRRSIIAPSRRDSGSRCSKRWDSPSAHRSRSPNPLDPRGAQDRLAGTAARDWRRASSRRAARSCRTGERGEIELRGDNVMLRYHKDPEATARTLRPRRVARDRRPRLSRRRRLLLHHRPPQGAHHQGRREHRAARDRRGACCKHPAVLEAAAVGIPDREYGQEILACVVLKPGSACTRGRTCAPIACSTLGRYKSPKEFRFLAELPKGPSGKVQRLKLNAGTDRADAGSDVDKTTARDAR